MQTIPMALTVLGLFAVILVVIAFVLPAMQVVTAYSASFPASLALLNTFLLPVFFMVIILIMVQAYYLTGV